MKTKDPSQTLQNADRLFHQGMFKEAGNFYRAVELSLLSDYVQVRILDNLATCLERGDDGVARLEDILAVCVTGVALKSRKLLHRKGVTLYSLGRLMDAKQVLNDYLDTTQESASCDYGMDKRTRSKMDLHALKVLQRIDDELGDKSTMKLSQSSFIKPKTSLTGTSALPFLVRFKENLKAAQSLYHTLKIGFTRWCCKRRWNDSRISLKLV